MRALPRTIAAAAIVAAIACEASGPADPTIALARFSLNTKRVSLGLDEQQQLTYQGTLPPGTTINWSSVDPSIAQVSNTGVVTGRSIGATMVVAAAKRSSDTATIVVHAPIATISLLPDSMSIRVGQTMPLTFEARDKQGRLITGLSNSSGKWGSTNLSVASVSSTGVVQANAVGDAAITFDMNGKSDTSYVHVVTVPIASITVSPSPSTAVNVGSFTKLVATAKDSAGNILQGRAISWTSSDSSRVYVTGDGSVTATNTGSAVVSASAEGKSASTTVNALPAVVARVSVAVDASNIQVGQSTQAVATAVDSSGNAITGRAVTWSSATPSVATVSSAGVITGAGVGTSIIAATVDGVAGSITETVSTSTVANLSVVLASSNILVGNTTQATATATDASGNVITGRTVTWKTSNSTVATVSTLGLVTAVAAGTVAISATVDGITSSATLVVAQPTISSITVTAPSTTVLAGQTVQATATVLDASGNKINTTVTWASSAPTVAGVSSAGLVSGLNAGSATISASAGGKSGSVPMTVQSTSTAPSGAVDAELPRVYLNTAVSNTPSNGRTLRVAAGGNLQAALDSALPGDRLLLAAGATFRGNFVIRPKTGGISGGWITVMSDGQLPPEGTRVSPAMASTYGFPKLVSPTIVSTLITDGPASRWRFIGLEITADSAVGSSQGLVLAGDASSAQYMASQVPTDLIYDRIYAHGWPTLDLRKCFAFNSANTAIIDSYVSECHSAFDAQAVTGTNGPGPYKIVNNYLEAGSENIGFGGAPIWIPNQLPTDIEIRRNYLSKPLSWKGIWNTKNLIELKDGVRILIEGNVLENSYPDAQAGFALMLWSANAVNNCSWCITQDITVRNNVIRNVAAGIAMASRYDASTLGMRNVTIRNNVMIGLDNPAVKGNGRIFQIQDTIPNLTIEHNTAFSPTNSSIIWGGAAPQVNHIVRNNLMGGGLYQLFAAGVGFGQAAWHAEAGPGSQLTGNVVALAPPAEFPAANFYPTTMADIGLVGGAASATSVDASPGDLALASSSPYKNRATDGTDPGADIAAVLAATANVKQP